MTAELFGFSHFGSNCSTLNTHKAHTQITQITQITHTHTNTHALSKYGITQHIVKIALAKTNNNNNNNTHRQRGGRGPRRQWDCL